MLTACAPKTESVELVYRFAPTREYPTIEEYVNHLNKDCDDCKRTISSTLTNICRSHG